MNEFFIKRGEKVQGPLSLKSLKHLADTGKLRESDLVARSKSGVFTEITHYFKLSQNQGEASSKSKTNSSGSDPAVSNQNDVTANQVPTPVGHKATDPLRPKTVSNKSASTPPQAYVDTHQAKASAHSPQVPLAADEPQSVNPLPVPSSTKQCPFCAETIAFAAIKCKHCGSMLTGDTPATPSITLPEMDVSGWRDNAAAWFMKHRVIFEFIALWLLWPAYVSITIGSTLNVFLHMGKSTTIAVSALSFVAAFGVSFWCRSRTNRQHHVFLVTSVWNLILFLLPSLTVVFLITVVIGFRTYRAELPTLAFLMAGPIGASLSGKLGTRVRMAILMFYGLKGPLKKRHLIHAVGTLVACCTLINWGQGVKRSMDYDHVVQHSQENLEEYLELRKSIVKLDVDVRAVSRFSDEMNQATSVGGFGATQRLNAVTSAMERDRQRVQSGKERLKTQIERALFLSGMLERFWEMDLPESRSNDLVPGYDFTWTQLRRIFDDDRNEFASMKR